MISLGIIIAAQYFFLGDVDCDCSQSSENRISKHYIVKLVSTQTYFMKLCITKTLSQISNFQGFVNCLNIGNSCCRVFLFSSQVASYYNLAFRNTFKTRQQLLPMFNQFTNPRIETVPS